MRAKTRKFDGETYRFSSGYRTKKYAENVKKGLKAKGKKVRIVRADDTLMKNAYCIYTKNK